MSAIDAASECMGVFDRALSRIAPLPHNIPEGLTLAVGRSYLDSHPTTPRTVRIVAEVTGSFGFVGIVTGREGDTWVQMYADDGEHLKDSGFGFSHLVREVGP